MKNVIFFLFIAVATLLQGCIIKSIHSFYSDDTVVFKQELVDTWFDRPTGTIFSVCFSKDNNVITFFYRQCLGFLNFYG